MAGVAVTTHRRGRSGGCKWLLSTLLVLPALALADDVRAQDRTDRLSQADAQLLQGILLRHGLRLADPASAYVNADTLARAVQQALATQAGSDKIIDAHASSQGRIDRSLTRSRTGALLADTQWRERWFDGDAAGRSGLPASPPAGTPVPETAKQLSPSPQKLFSVTLKAPPGFQGAAYPRDSRVSVWWQGRHIIDTDIVVQPTTFMFAAPRVVMATLGDAVDDKRTVLDALSGPLDHNAGKLCLGYNDAPDCGSVTTDSVAAIYDEEADRIDLFLAGTLLQLVPQRSYIPPAQAGNSLVLHHYAITSVSDVQETTVDAAAGLLYGYGQGNIQINGDYRSGREQYRLLDAKLTHYLPDYQFIAGSFDHSPGGSSNDLRMLGVSFHHSNALRQDRNRVYGTPLDVTLSRPSTVQLAVDDRVYSGQYLNEGTHFLDTSALPLGSYEVEIRIRDTGGTTRTESTRFSKFDSLPEPGHVQASVSAGTPLEYRQNAIVPESSAEVLLGASIATRIGDNSSLLTGVSQLDDRSYVHSEWLHLRDNQQYQVAATVDDTGDYGLVAAGSLHAPRFSLNVAGEIGTADAGTPRSEASESLIPSDVARLSVGGDVTLGDYRVGARHRISDSDVDGRSSRSTAYVNRRWLRGAGLRASAEARYQREDDVDSVYLGVRMTSRTVDRVVGAATSVEIDERGELSPGAELSAAWVTTRHPTFDASASSIARLRREDLTTGLEGQLATDAITASAALVVTDSNEDRRHDGYAAIGGSVAFGPGLAAMASDRYTRAGVLVRVEADSAQPDDSFDIYIDNSRRQTTRHGRTVFIPLDPFRTYSLHVEPQQGVSQGISNEVHEFTLYPGTVHDITLDNAGKYLLIAKVVDLQGVAVAGAIAENLDEAAITNSDGILQAEVRPGQELLLQRRDRSECRVDAPEVDDEDFVVLEAPMICLE